MSNVQIWLQLRGDDEEEEEFDDSVETQTFITSMQ